MKIIYSISLKLSWAAGFLFRHAGLFLVVFYQKICSPLTPGHCRFYPTCSQYAKEALLSRQHKLYLATWLIVKRIAKCHRAHPGGVDLLVDHPNKKPAG